MSRLLESRCVSREKEKEGGGRGHGLNAVNISYAVACHHRYTSTELRIRNCGTRFVVVPACTWSTRPLIKGRNSRNNATTNSRGRNSTSEWSLKLLDDHKTAPIGIYHLGAYYRRARSPRVKTEEGRAGSKLDDNFTQASRAALTSNRWLPPNKCARIRILFLLFRCFFFL